MNEVFLKGCAREVPRKKEAFQNELLIKIFLLYTCTRVWHSQPGGDCILCGFHRVKKDNLFALNSIYLVDGKCVYISVYLLFFGFPRKPESADFRRKLTHLTGLEK